MRQLSLEYGTTPITSTAPRLKLNTVARHIHSGCECRVIEAPINEIERITEDGGVPILNIEPNDTDKLGLSARRWDGSTKFVVLKHAVSDGFGSPSKKTMTTCQLIRIADRMGKLQVEEVRAQLCFWMDTLCASDQSEEKVSKVYSNAYAVLCFDTRPLPVHPGSSVKDSQFESYVASLFQNHPELGLNRRFLLVTNQGTIDMKAGDASDSGIPRNAEDFGPDLSKGDLDWRPAHERAEKRSATILRDHMQFSVLRR